MRTTLTIDDDVLTAAKAIARQEGRSVGEVVSDLARRALRRPPAARERNGVPLLQRKPGDAPVTLDVVNALRDEPHPAAGMASPSARNDGDELH